MAHTVVALNCPGCGEPANTTEKNCKYCGRPVIISTFNSVASMTIPELNKYTNTYKQALALSPNDKDLHTSIGMCYLKLKLYDNALPSFEKAMECDFDNSENYFYAGVCLLKGQKPFNAHRSGIMRILELLNAAIQIEPRGIFYYFRAYIKYDFYERKSLNISPKYDEDVASAKANNVTLSDIQILSEILGKPFPNEIAVA